MARLGWALAVAAAGLLLLGRPVAAQDLILDNTTVMLGGVKTYGTVSLTNNAKIIVPAFNGTDKVSTGNLQIRASRITIDATSSIVADGKGYQTPLCGNGRGPTSTAGGRGGCAVLDSGGGGAHFGTGGRGTKDCNCFGSSTSCQFPQEFEESCGNLNAQGTACVAVSGAPGGVCPAANNSCYNNDGLPTVAGQPSWHSIYAPEFGAAGGDKGCRDDGADWDTCNVAGSGGGRIVLAAVDETLKNGALTISGRVSANGRRGCAKGNDSGGGGAGGTIVLAGDQVTVSAGAKISAAGGLGGDSRGNVNGDNPDCNDKDPVNGNTCAQQGGTCDDCGGGGGGGIISVLSRSPASLASLAVFNVRGAEGGTCPICKGEAGGSAGELQLDGVYTGEFCDGYDNDFDGQVDEGLGNVSCGAGACQTTLPLCNTSGSSSGLPSDCVPLAQPTCQAPLTDARTRFLVIVDTSGSMLTDLNGAYTFGDGSAGHLGLDTNGDGQAGNDSRLFKAKWALTKVMSAYPEIDYALARYAQGVAPGVNCQLAHWFECAGLCCTYDDPTSNTGTNPEGPCTVTKVGSHAPVTVLPTSKGEECINYAGSCGAPHRGADILVGFERPLGQTLMWLDNKETKFDPSTTEGDHCNFAGGGDCELRGTGPTPLADALYAAKAYLAKTRAMDVVGSCRTYSVILLTDGAETCNGSPATAAGALLKEVGAETYVVGFSVLAAEQASLNQIANAGSPTGNRAAFFVGNESQLAAALASIVAKSVRYEVCNDKDDDCDTLIDEDFPLKGQPCNNGKLGVCYKTGTYVCKADGTGVVCNAPDGGSGTAETCNGLDDNCNGQIDEGLLNCVPPICTPEICNGKDDDCDKVVDNDIPSTACGKAVGVCTTGVTKCVGGNLICEGGSSGGPELCDNLDNDCDGIVDSFSEPCYSFPVGCDLKAGSCVGTCRIGTKTCTTGAFGVCVGEAGPQKEECNGLDDDCNGKVDDGAVCPNGSQCIEGACAQQCGSSEFNCPKGQLCKNGWCTIDPCDPVECDQQHPGWLCRQGQCIDPCLGVSCEPGFQCQRGLCEDQSCYGQGCPNPGEKCLQGTCQKDPCYQVTCKADEFCQAGRCVPVCDTVVCAAGEVCTVVESGGLVSTRCVTDPCAGVKCPSGTVCKGGRCVTDTCAGLSCAPGKVCQDGKCVPDLCEQVRCPPGYLCKAGLCSSPVAEGAVDILATGGGGGACSLSDHRGPAPGLPFLLVLCGLLGLGLALPRGRA